jgi:hypothetical protein
MSAGIIGVSVGVDVGVIVGLDVGVDVSVGVIVIVRVSVNVGVGVFVRQRFEPPTLESHDASECREQPALHVSGAIGCPHELVPGQKQHWMGVGVIVGVSVIVGVNVMVAVGVALGVMVKLGVTVGVWVGELLGVSLGDAEGVAVRVVTMLRLPSSLRRSSARRRGCQRGTPQYPAQGV